MKFYEQYLDPKLPVAQLVVDWSSERCAMGEIARLVDTIKPMIWAEQIPRRLGGKATGAELRNDKRQLRRLTHGLRTVLASWGRLSDGPTVWNWDVISPDQKRRGAQMDVVASIRDQLGIVEVKRRYGVTCAIHLGLHQWANRACQTWCLEEDLYHRILETEQPRPT